MIPIKKRNKKRQKKKKYGGSEGEGDVNDIMKGC
jgi:hypothetical protein